LSSTGSGEAEDGISGTSECTRRSALFWMETAPVEGTEEGNVEVSGVAGGIVLAEVSMSRVAPAAAGSGKMAGVQGFSMVV